MCRLDKIVVLAAAMLLGSQAQAASFVLDFTVGPHFELPDTPYGITRDSVLTGHVTFEADNNSFATDVTSFELVTPEKSFTKADLDPVVGTTILTGNEQVTLFTFHLSDFRGDIFSDNAGIFIEDAATNYCNNCVNYTSGVAASVPEPSIWALIVAGFGLAGAGLRRRSVAAAFEPSASARK